MNTMKKDERFITEIFADKFSAEKAYNDAITQGYKPEEINVLMSEDSRQKYYGTTTTTSEYGDKSMEGLAIGGAVGGVVAGTLAAVAAIGTNLALPGFGLVIAGPLAAGLAGVGAGSLSGGFVGALIGWGIPEERARVYEKGIKSGGIVLVMPKTPGMTVTLENEWKKVS